MGLYEFLYAWFPEPKIFPWGIRLNNLIASMPNDADLDEIYSIEQKRFLKNEEMKLSKLYRSCILRYANECFWEGPVHMKGVGVMFQGSGGSGHANTVIAGNRNQSLAKDWIPVYLVVQGHRMVWWKVEDEITLAQSSVAQLLLYGLAGTTQPSPVDIRDVGDGSRMLAVFGRDISGSPQKFTVICKDSMECLKLMEALNQAVLSS